MLPWETKPEKWPQFFVRIRMEHFAKQSPPVLTASPCTAERFIRFRLEAAEGCAEVAAVERQETVCAGTGVFFRDGVQPAAMCGSFSLSPTLLIASQVSLRLVDYDRRRRPPLTC